MFEIVRSLLTRRVHPPHQNKCTPMGCFYFICERVAVEEFMPFDIALCTKVYEVPLVKTAEVRNDLPSFLFAWRIALNNKCDKIKAKLLINESIDYSRISCYIWHR